MIFCDELLEAFGPHLDNTELVAQSLRDEEGMPVRIANRAMQRLWLKTPVRLSRYDLIRRKERRL